MAEKAVTRDASATGLLSFSQACSPLDAGYTYACRKTDNHCQLALPRHAIEISKLLVLLVFLQFRGGRAGWKAICKITANATDYYSPADTTQLPSPSITRVESAMIDSTKACEIISGLQDGSIVPYIGPGVLADVKSKLDQSSIPADSDSLILAMNNGQPMAPRLMYEFPRAAMNLELKKGRSFVERFLTETYGKTEWTRAAFHDWLASIKPHYVIDINRDTQVQQTYGSEPHTLIVGCARVAGTDYRFNIFAYDGATYRPIEQEVVNPELPILFKPMGTPLPTPNYVASDADYVDYITELMGGFAIPSFLKEYRNNRQYLFVGVRMTRDTERMVLSDIVYGANSPTGYAVLPDASDKELRFCKNKNIEVIDATWQELVAAANESATVEA